MFKFILIVQQNILVREYHAYVAYQISTSDRLLGFFGVNPLFPYALEESQYWADRYEASGLKLHFASSNADPFDREYI